MNILLFSPQFQFIDGQGNAHQKHLHHGLGSDDAVQAPQVIEQNDGRDEQNSIAQEGDRSVLERLEPVLLLLSYEKGELVTSPLLQEQWFQVVVQGSLNIYFIRDDGERYSLSSGKTDYILGDMELFQPSTGSIYTEAAEPLLCLALAMGQNREMLLEDNRFLQMVCQSLTAKLAAITALNAAPCSLSQRVLSYMRYKCPGNVLKGLEQEAFHLHCSARQLQRILNQLEQQGRVAKTGKGTYRLTERP